VRTINSFKNIITGISGQVLTIFLQFASRTVFIYVLGKEYLGISALFTNILSILSVTELGIGTAIVYSLYKPLVEKDIKKISSTMNFLKKAYFIVGFTIAVLGLLLMPFLPHIIKGTTGLVNIKLVYLLYLFQSVSSYWFFAYKGALLQADQKKYIANIIRYIVSVITVIAQIVVLILFRSFLSYVLIGVVSHLCINIITARKVDKMYPYLKDNKKETLSKEERRVIYKNLFGVSMYKINSTIVRSTDNIVISMYISTIAVGLYSNYHLIVGTLIRMAKMIFSSFTASVGNLFVSESKERSVFIFKCLSFLSFWLYGFSSICLWILFNPFIILWVGKEYLFAEYIVLVIVLDFLMDGYQQVSISYKDACGLFWQGKYRPIATAVLNIAISIILAPRIGIAGVLLGTIISRLLTTWWFEPWMIYKYAFNRSPIQYFKKYIGFFILVIATGAITQVATIPYMENTLFNFMIKFLLCIIIPNSIFFLLFRKSDEFKYILSSIKRILKSYKK